LAGAWCTRKDSNPRPTA